MTDKLLEICAAKRLEVAKAKAGTPLDRLRRAVDRAPAPRGFARALATKAERGFGIIAEIKKASPSAGLIRADFDPAALARAYQAGGAACLSVLTDAPYFQGANAYLTAASTATALPVLRKDFIVDPWQVWETRALGADCLLLILAALTDDETQALYALASELGLDILLEVHDETELSRALALPSGLIGINNRNLKTLRVDLATTERLGPRVDAGRAIVGESGLKTRDDLERLAKVGVRRFLIGESLMREPDVTLALQALLPPLVDGP
jgi:indole-3-glycerol phosphate synthase